MKPRNDRPVIICHVDTVLTVRRIPSRLCDWDDRARTPVRTRGKPKRGTIGVGP